MFKRLAVIMLSCVTFSSFATTRVEGVRVWASPESTRVVLELSQKQEYNLFHLDNPHRVVLDLKDTTWASDLQNLDLADTGIVQIRTANKRGGDLRVVIDLNQALTSKNFILLPQGEYGHRLVIDLDKPASAIQVKPKLKEAIEDSNRTELKSVVSPLMTRDFIIAIDAGHGGEDPGAVGQRFKTHEKDVVLKVAQKLEALINQQSGMEAFLVRKGDYYIGLRKRMQIAREQGADLFLSLHADSFKNTAAHGASVYVLSGSGASNEASRWLAERENRADLIGGISLDDKGDVLASVLLDLSQTANLSVSEEVAQEVLDSLSKVVKLHQPQVQRAGFAVLKSPDVPSILIELGFISNHQGESNLRSPSYQMRLAQAVFAGVQKHLSGKPRPIVYQQQGLKKALTYLVKPGDTLSQIAFEMEVSTSVLKKLNDLSSDSIQVGQRLILPEHKSS